MHGSDKMAGGEEMGEEKTITQHVGVDLAELLADKILDVYENFPRQAYVNAVNEKCGHLSYSKRIELHAEELYHALPKDYETAINILVSVLGEENEKETGMFSEFYWILPIGKYVEKYGLDHFDLSLKAIEEITKRNTGEYAIRPFIRKDPDRLIKTMTEWATSENFHLRRLASEGLRPKLPWAPKLDTFIDNPQPVFAILELLKEDQVMFVKKSVANHLTDWLKVNKEPTAKLIKQWSGSEDKHTQWIIKRATRKITI
ncbi:3-methyladenine DNA glycosylase AlkC [Tindallia magadiensis]|uniref:3-methyladenine DNA glycosylase AlkC n=2 Tax=Tindallia magadiensis TaxID=69895 RepID=A0A1I3BSH6_9FIRM|nr:3-methyladenine DNA glycosylase AlkC [Tindallia magadiensis]